MLEVTILNYLDNVMPDPVRMERQENAPGRYYIIEKTGGGRTEHIGKARIAIQSYADTMAEAADMNLAVIDAMCYGCISLDEIANIELNSDYNFTDTTTKKYRYQAIFDVVHYDDRRL